MNNTKLNVYKKDLREVCEKLKGAEQFIKEIIEQLCSNQSCQWKSYLIYLRTIKTTFKAETSCVLLKSYKHHFLV